MKVEAFKSDTEMLVSMTVTELLELSGFAYADSFNKAFGTKLCYSSTVPDSLRKRLFDVENIPVSSIFSEAKETLSAYEDLRSKFESIRNQLTTLMGKMVKARPGYESKKE